MGDAAEQQRAHGDVDHSLRHVEALPVVVHQAVPADHPAEWALDGPSARDDLEACRFVGPPDDLDDEVEEGGVFHELRAVAAR